MCYDPTEHPALPVGSEILGYMATQGPPCSLLLHCIEVLWVHLLTQSIHGVLVLGRSDVSELTNWGWKSGNTLAFFF